MPQGSLKKTTAKKPAKVTKHAQNPRPAAPRQRVAKKKGAVLDSKIAKKHSATLTSATEKLLASRVGHLELLKGTRREIEKAAAAKAKAQAKK